MFVGPLMCVTQRDLRLQGLPSRELVWFHAALIFLSPLIILQNPQFTASGPHKFIHTSDPHFEIGRVEVCFDQTRS